MVSVNGKPAGSCSLLLHGERNGRSRFISLASAEYKFKCIGIFILHKHNGRRLESFAPPKQLFLCNLCCAGEAELSLTERSWCQIVREGDVQWFCHSDRCGRNLHRVCDVSAAVPMYYTILPAGISLCLCFMNITCLFIFFPLSYPSFVTLSSQNSLSLLLQNGFIC